jgi:tetratricopeptide (TPR) repeat protein
LIEPRLHLRFRAAPLRQSASRDAGRLPELENAVRLAPAVFDYRFRLGSACLAIGRYERATAELQEAVAIDKTQAAAWSALGQARNGYATFLIETRQPEGAIEESQKCWLTIPQTTQLT